MHVPRNIQSPFTATDFWNNWAGVTPRMALFIKVTSKPEFGSLVRAFTSNSRNMTMPGHPGVTFYSAPAITNTVFEQVLGESPTMEITGVYSSDSFDPVEVKAGKWGSAEVEIFSASWDDGTGGGQDRRKYGELLHGRGKIADIKDYQTYFTAEIRGLISLLSQDVNKATARLCRVHEFGDDECKKNLAGTVTIESVVYNLTETGLELDDTYLPSDTFIDVLIGQFAGNVPPENFYANGKMTVTGGPNNGLSREIAYNSAVTGDYISVQLKRPFPFSLSESNATVDLIAGCDRTIEMCMLYDNILNRRAEDYIPGLEQIHRLPTG